MQFQPITRIRTCVLIADAIRSSIVASNLSLGDKLPPVKEIADKLGVSCPSVRKAITLLSSVGIVDTCKKRCTLVKSMRDEHGKQLLSELIRIGHKGIRT